jgi:TP901 family phage tail tape measure protein
MEAKEYILSILAQLKGQQAVLSGLQGLGTVTSQVGDTAQIAGAKTNDFGNIIEKAGQRALIVAPIWMAIRTVMLAVLTTIKDMIQANIELEDNMAKLQASLRGTTSEISAQLNSIQKEILDTSMNSRFGVAELSKAFIPLQRIIGDTSIAMSGLKATEALMTDTGMGAEKAGKLIAQTYLQVADKMDKALTPAEKFNKIVDILTFTEFRQGASVDSVAQGYSKLAPFLTGTSDKFENMITLLGMLNTHFVEGGRAGQSLSQEIVNLSKNSKELANVFNLQLNPNKPISIIDTFTQLREKLKNSTTLSASQSDALSKVFGGARTSAPSREILTFFDELIAKLQDAEMNATGFADKTKKIVDNTISAQFKQFKADLGALSIEFTNGAGHVTKYQGFLQSLNDWLVSIRPNVQGLGIGLGFLTENFKRYVEIYDKFLHGNITGGLQVHNIGFTAYVDEWLKSQRTMEEHQKRSQGVASEEAVQQGIKLDSKKEETQYAKELGALLQTMGASETQILEVKMQQLQIDASSKGIEVDRLELEKLRLQQVIAIAKEKEKEKSAESDLAFQYEKADDMEKGRLRRMMELRLMSGEDIQKQYQTNPYDTGIIEQYRKNFTKQQQETIGGLIAEKNKLPTGMPEEGITKVPEEAIKGFKTGASQFWDEWDRLEHDKAKTFGKDFAQSAMNEFAGLGNIGTNVNGLSELFKKLTEGTSGVHKGEGVNTQMEINVNIPFGGAHTEWEAEVRKRVKALLETDPQLQRTMTKIVTNTKP